MARKKALDQRIPFLLEAFVHGENAVGNPGGEQQLPALEFEINEHSGNILRREGAARLCKRARKVLRGQQKYEFKIRRRPFPLDEVKALRAHLPKGQKRQPGKSKLVQFLCGIEIAVQFSFKIPCDTCLDRRFLEQEVVERLRAEQLVHKILDT